MEACVQGQLRLRVCALQDVYVVSEYRTTWPRWYIQVQHVVYVDLETAFTFWRFNYLITDITVDSLISGSQRILVLQEHIRAVLDNLEAWRTSKERKEAEFTGSIHRITGNRRDSLPSLIMAPFFFSLVTLVLRVPVGCGSCAHFRTHVHKNTTTSDQKWYVNRRQNLCPNKELPVHIYDNWQRNL